MLQADPCDSSSARHSFGSTIVKTSLIPSDHFPRLHLADVHAQRTMSERATFIGGVHHLEYCHEPLPSCDDCEGVKAWKSERRIKSLAERLEPRIWSR